jgi:hypothetical protein
MDKYLAEEAKKAGAPIADLLAHLAHRQNQPPDGFSFPRFEIGENGFTER